MDLGVNQSRKNTVDQSNMDAFGLPLVFPDIWKKPKTTFAGSIFEILEPFEEDLSQSNNPTEVEQPSIDRINCEAYYDPVPPTCDNLDALGPEWWVFDHEAAVPVVSPNFRAYDESNEIDKESLLDEQLPNINHQLISPQNQPKRIGCRCGMSKCLRLHCRCFRDLEYCMKNCRCTDCFNNETHDQVRSFVIQKTKEINRTAFAKKMVYLDHEKDKINSDGCNCKTGCNRNYCECYKNQTGCSALCKCQNCKNLTVSIPETRLKPMFVTINRKKNKIVIENLKSISAQTQAQTQTQTQESEIFPEFSLREQFAMISNSTQESTHYAQEGSRKRSRTSSCVITYQNYKKVKVEVLPYNSN